MDPQDIQLPADFSAVTDDQLNELESAARFAAAPLAQRVAADEDLDEDELDTVIRLGNVVEGVAGERTRRITAAAEAASKKDAASKAATVLADKAGEKPSVAVVAAATGSTPSAAATSVNEPAPIRESYTTMVAAAGAPGTTPGHEFANWDEIGESLEQAMASYGSNPTGGYMRTSVVQFRRNYPEELRVGAKDSAKTVAEKLDYAADQTRLEQPLTAAAGWCAPSQILYDLFEIENGTFGMVDIPEMQISRGGIQYTPGPDFSAIWGGSGYWHQTEANVQAATSKPTMVVPCPSFTNTRLEVDGVAITGAFLQDRGYPEMVARFGRGAMIAHARRMNALKLNYITDGSVLKDYTAAGGHVPATVSEAKDLTTVSRLLATFGWQAMDYRYRFRMAGDALIDIILPFWVLEAAAEDIARRWVADIDDAMTFALDEFTRYFDAKRLRCQWVYDWQDAYNLPLSTFGTNFFTNDTSTFVGTATGGSQLYTVPRTVYGLLFAPGTWVAGVSDVIKLDTVYDSTNLALNQYVQLFTEEGILMAKRGYESRLLKMTIDPSGTYSASTAMVDA